MPALDIIMDGDGCWPDLIRSGGKVGDVDAELVAAALLIGGMQSGKSSVTLRLRMPDGNAVLAQTSLDLLEAAVRAFRGREAGIRDGTIPDPRKGKG
jgi:hypothetical protein